MQRMLPAGEPVPALGQGTWNLGDDPQRRGEEIAALRRGIDLGLTLVDTAEMYGDGGSRERVEENAGALERRLTREQLQELDRLFAPPSGPGPLAML